MNDDSKPHVRVHFELVQDQDGYPPASVETLWARPEADGTFTLDSIPFFASSVAIGDRLRAAKREDGLWFAGVIFPSLHSTVRVLVVDVTRIAAIRDVLRDLGCESELSHIPQLIAVDVPGSVDYGAVRDYLERLEAAGEVEYEEAAVR